MSQWIAAYGKTPPDSPGYQSIGSPEALAQINATTVDFGASDLPISPDILAAMGAVQFPILIEGVVPLVNISGVAPDQLHLDGGTLADIFSGLIKKWNDSAIVQLNPGLALPADPITVVQRSDGCGTTYNFTRYQSLVRSSWASATARTPR